MDYAKQPPGREDLQRWRAGFGELPVNRQGTTFRKIKAVYETANDSRKAALLQENPSAIKRPILEGDGVLLKGFDPATWPSGS